MRLARFYPDMFSADANLFCLFGRVRISATFSGSDSRHHLRVGLQSRLTNQ